MVRSANITRKNTTCAALGPNGTKSTFFIVHPQDHDFICLGAIFPTQHLAFVAWKAITAI
jgi:hypothetical protein